MNEAPLSQRGYDRLARSYRWLEWLLFGRDLQRARLALLNQLPSCDRALVLGDGDGRLLQQLCRSHPHCQITSVDHSREMLQLQQQRVTEVGASDRVTFVCRDATDFQPTANQYDLLITAFFLDCFTEETLRQCLPRWLAGIQPDGWYGLVDFVSPRSGWRRLRAACYLSLMHWFFRWQTGLTNRQLVDLDGVLESQTISLATSHLSNHDMISSRVYRIT